MVKTWPGELPALLPKAGSDVKGANCWPPASNVAGGGKTGGFWRLKWLVDVLKGMARASKWWSHSLCKLTVENDEWATKPFQEEPSARWGCKYVLEWLTQRDSLVSPVVVGVRHWGWCKAEITRKVENLWNGKDGNFFHNVKGSATRSPRIGVVVGGNTESRCWYRDLWRLKVIRWRSNWMLVSQWVPGNWFACGKGGFLQDG